MRKNISRFTIMSKEFSLCHEGNLHSISRLLDCVNSFKRGELDATTSLEKCRKILNEINDPEFPFFATRHFRELFSYILYELPKASARQKAAPNQSQEKKKKLLQSISLIKGREKRRYKRIKMPFPVMFRMRRKLFPSFWNMAKAEDLGIMGIRFYYKNPPKIGSLVDIIIGISQPARTIHCVGKTLRTKGNQDSSRSVIAIEFVHIGESEKFLLNLIIGNNSE